MWRKYISQLLNVHGFNEVKQTEINTAERRTLEPSVFEVQLAIKKLIRHKLPGTDQVPAELIKVGGRTILYEIHNLTISIWIKEEFLEEWKESIIVTTYKKGDNTDCSNCRGN